MKKILFCLTASVGWVVASALPAIAQGYDVGGSGGEPEVAPNVIVRAPSELAFTGFGSVVMLLAIAAALLAVGLVTLGGSRRLRRPAAS
jgi:hypothetical protein